MEHAQELSIAAISMLAGIFLLMRGGDWTIDGAVFTARKIGMSPLLVGFTVVAFGTSLPELLVSVFANLEGSAGIALGNVLGSNIANILFVIAASALITTLHVVNRTVYRDLVIMLFSTALLAALLLYGEIGRSAGLTMVALLIAYVFYSYMKAQKDKSLFEEPEKPEFKNILTACGVLILGLIAIALGAEFLVSGAKTAARIIGVPEAVIGLSIIALGTSLPELSTCLSAAKKGHGDLLLGNIIGSNVFNILMIIGITAIIKPIAAGSFEDQLVNFDIWITAGVSLLFAALLITVKKITKPVGIVFLTAYIMYNTYIYAIYVAP